MSRASFVLLFIIAAEVASFASPRAMPLEGILSSPSPGQDAWFELYRWDLFPSVLVMDTKDFHSQDRAFSRLAFFLEKRDFRGRLLGNQALAGMRGWNAHDYGPQGLAAFFDAAQRRGFPLNQEEITLRRLLLENGLLTRVHDRYAPGAGGIISISRSSSSVDRQLLLIHESFHGVFFVSARYRAFSFQTWDSLDSRVKRFFRTFLDELGYDADDQYLTVNEFQAYLMQQPARYAPEYFKRTMERFKGGVEDVPVQAILNAAHRLESFLWKEFRIRAGTDVLNTSETAERGLPR